MGREAQIQATGCSYTVAAGDYALGSAVNCLYSVGMGYEAMKSATNCSNSVFIGSGAGKNATNSSYCAAFGPNSTVANNSQYRYAYGYGVTNNVADYSHVFGHQGTNYYAAITKNGSCFHGPVILSSPQGDLSMGSFTNGPSQL